jgi:rhodanese-related sulfurtransferase
MKQHNPGFLAVVDDARSRIRETNPAEVLRRRAAGEAFTLVDVREESEWAAGRVAGAVHLGKGVIERDVETKFPDKAAPLVLYCGGGFRSALACDMLQKMGYTDVSSMDGGWRGWNEAGGPVEGAAT